MYSSAHSFCLHNLLMSECNAKCCLFIIEHVRLFTFFVYVLCAGSGASLLSFEDNEEQLRTPRDVNTSLRGRRSPHNNSSTATAQSTAATSRARGNRSRRKSRSKSPTSSSSHRGRQNTSQNCSFVDEDDSSVGSFGSEPIITPRQFSGDDEQEEHSFEREYGNNV